MTVSASVITDAKPDVLIIPSSAVKSQGQNAFILVPAFTLTSDEQNLASTGVPLKNKPVSKSITTGSSNDTSIEVINGLQEGDWIITRTLTGTAATQKPATTGNGAGGNRGRGGFGGFGG